MRDPEGEGWLLDAKRESGALTDTALEWLTENFAAITAVGALYEFSNEVSEVEFLGVPLPRLYHEVDVTWEPPATSVSTGADAPDVTVVLCASFFNLVVLRHKAAQA